MSNTATKEYDPQLRTSMDREGVDGAVSVLRELEGGVRLEGFAYAQQLFGSRGAAPVSLDDYAALVRIGIDEAIRQSQAGGGDAAKDLANRMSYNLSADLAACWPDDTLPRERRHFEAGLAAAEDCIRWRDELNKPDERKSIAWWAKGMHLFSLGRFNESLDAFGMAARLSGVAPDDKPQSSWEFGQILNIGYCGLAQIALGDDAGRGVLASANAAYKEQCEDPAKLEDAQFGIDQLGVVEANMKPK